MIQTVGGTMQPREQYELPADTEVYLQWGYKLTNAMETAMARGIPYIILDGSYFRDFQEHALDAITISINGFHGLGLDVDMGKRRPRPKPELKPWRDEPEDGVCYVYNQLQKDRATMQADMDAWSTRSAVEATERFGKKAIIRPHPKMINPWEPPLPLLEDTFKEAHVAITWTSTVGVTALIEGVPTVAMHPASPAYGGCPSNIERRTIDRDEWMHKLSYRQYQTHDLDAAWAYIELCMPEAVKQAKAGAYSTEGLRR
jgi:hypothetical protein